MSTPPPINGPQDNPFPQQQNAVRPVAGGPPIILEYRSPDGDGWDQVVKIAHAQKKLLWMVLVNIGSIILYFMIVGPALRGAVDPVGGLAILILGWMGLLTATVFEIYFLVKLMLAMRWHIVAVVLLPIGFVISGVGLIILVVVNQIATSRLQRAGLRVGFMGATIPDGPPPPPAAGGPVRPV